MAIMGFIIVVAGRAFSDSTKMRVRSQSMLASAEEAGRVSALLKEDISQMGAKSWGRSSASGTAFDTIAGVYMNYNTKDFSSYNLKRNQPAMQPNIYDSLFFRKAYYDASGICGAVLEVQWYVKDSILVRKCKPLAPKPPRCTSTSFTASTDCPDSLEIARNVTEFRLLPSIPGMEGSPSSSSNLLFPASGSNAFHLQVKNSPNSNATATLEDGRVILRGFLGNSSSGTEHADFYLHSTAAAGDCQTFKFKAGEEYAIDFELPCDNPACKTGSTEQYNKMIMFQPGRDHLSVGLRQPGNPGGNPISGIPDFLFYPPQDNTTEMKRRFEFSVPKDTTACVGITAAFYSPEAYNGRLEIRNLQVSRKTDNVYHFDRSSNSSYNPSASSKADVKAFELTLGVMKKKEIGRSVVVIPVPNNGIISLVSGGN